MHFTGTFGKTFVLVSVALFAVAGSAAQINRRQSSHAINLNRRGDAHLHRRRFHNTASNIEADIPQFHRLHRRTPPAKPADLIKGKNLPGATQERIQEYKDHHMAMATYHADNHNDKGVKKHNEKIENANKYLAHYDPSITPKHGTEMRQ